MSYLLHISRVCLKCSNQMAFCVSTDLQVDLDAVIFCEANYYKLTFLGQSVQNCAGNTNRFTHF